MARNTTVIHEFDDDNDEVDTASTFAAGSTETEAKTRTIAFSMKVAEAICERIATGEPLQAICVGDEWPTVTQVTKWLMKYAKFEEMYEQARIMQADYLADERLVLLQEMRRNPTKAAALKAASDLLAKQTEWLNPRKYGPKMDLNVTERAKTPDEIKAEIARLREELGVPAGRIARLK